MNDFLPNLKVAGTISITFTRKIAKNCRPNYLSFKMVINVTHCSAVDYDSVERSRKLAHLS